MATKSVTTLSMILGSTVLWSCGDDSEKTIVPDAAVSAVGDAAGARCTVTADCPQTTPTVECNAGLCIDRTWGCIGQPDERPAATSSTATFKVGIYDLTRQPLATAPTMRLCTVSTAVDASCQPVPGAAATYDNSTGMATVTGLPNNAPFRLAVEFAAGSGLLPVDVYSQRPPRDTTMEMLPVVSSSLGTLTALSAAYQPPIAIDPNGGPLIVVANDCNGTPVAGVNFGFNAADALPTTRSLYLDAQGLPDPALTQSSSGGFGAIINLPAQKSVPLTFKVGQATLPGWNVTAQRDRLTMVYVHPRKYTP